MSDISLLSIYRLTGLRIYNSSADAGQTDKHLYDLCDSSSTRDARKRLYNHHNKMKYQ